MDTETEHHEYVPTISLLIVALQILHGSGPPNVRLGINFAQARWTRPIEPPRRSADSDAYINLAIPSLQFLLKCSLSRPS